MSYTAFEAKLDLENTIADFLNITDPEERAEKLEPIAILVKNLGEDEWAAELREIIAQARSEAHANDWAFDEWRDNQD